MSFTGRKALTDASCTGALAGIGGSPAFLLAPANHLHGSLGARKTSTGREALLDNGGAGPLLGVSIGGSGLGFVAEPSLTVARSMICS